VPVYHQVSFADPPPAPKPRVTFADLPHPAPVLRVLKLCAAASSLRVDTDRTDPASASPTRHTETSPAPPTPLSSKNYQDYSGPTGRRRHRQAHKPKTKSKPQRRSKRITNRASYTKQPIHSDIPVITSHVSNWIQYLAMHGPAMNPDTGSGAEYRKLSKSSDG
jgi:hypothetical protein